MNKLYTATISVLGLTIGLALPTGVLADPDRGGSNWPHMANRDGVVVSYQGGQECRLDESDRFIITENISIQNSVRIEVTSGPNKGCSGDVRRSEIRRAPLESRSNDSAGAENANARESRGTISVRTNYQKVVVTDKWVRSFDGVPVFKTRNNFFQGRSRVDQSPGNQQLADQLRPMVACILLEGDQVIAQPYRNWGVSSVLAVKGKPNCRGWIDRGTIR